MIERLKEYSTRIKQQKSMTLTKQLALRWVFALFCLVAVRASDRQNHGNLRRNDDHESESNTHATADLSSILNVEMTPEETASLQTSINSSDIHEVDVSSLQFIHLPQIALLTHRTALEQQILVEVSRFQLDMVEHRQKAQSKAVDIKARIKAMRDLAHQIELQIDNLAKKMKSDDEIPKEGFVGLYQISDRLLEVQTFWEKRLSIKAAQRHIENVIPIIQRKQTEDEKRSRVEIELQEQMIRIMEAYKLRTQQFNKEKKQTKDPKDQIMKIDNLKQRIVAFIGFVEQNGEYCVQYSPEKYKLALNKLSIDLTRIRQFWFDTNKNYLKEQNQEQKNINQFEQVREMAVKEQLAEAMKMHDFSREELADQRDVVKNMVAPNHKNYYLTMIPLDLNLAPLELYASISGNKQVLLIIKDLKECNQALTAWSVNTHIVSRDPQTNYKLEYLKHRDRKQLLQINKKLTEKMLSMSSQQLSKTLINQAKERYVSLIEKVHWLMSYTKYKSRVFFGIRLDSEEKENKKKPAPSKQSIIAAFRQHQYQNFEGESTLAQLDGSQRYSKSTRQRARTHQNAP